ncbi:hypothetical protein NQ315_017415 [Exocentrus adspersus]|uniref:Uncharacterized protein n=1 Tax=Exocentrus adspersus TaxID=1586481 RepID=A0AAV8VLE4_9CUCU|nr:hypothetical protein NQ315_017415 [Exocentrus adspersus]
MSTASSSSSGYNSASSSSMLAMDSDSEEYSKELDEILARYERAASMERIYLLHTVFPLLTNCLLIQCGLSPARSFTPAIIIQHMYKPLKLSFSIYEWNALMELLQQLVDNFFSAPIEGCPDEYDPVMHKCDDNIFVSTHVCENVKVLSIKKYDVTTELFAEDTKELLNISKLVLSPRIIMDNSLWKTQKALKTRRRPVPSLHGEEGIVHTNRDKAEAFADSLELQCRENQLDDEDEEHTALVERRARQIGQTTRRYVPRPRRKSRGYSNT